MAATVSVQKLTGAMWTSHPHLLTTAQGLDGNTSQSFRFSSDSGKKEEPPPAAPSSIQQLLQLHLSLRICKGSPRDTLVPSPG